MILISIRFSYPKSWNEVKTDGLNTEEVYELCLLGEKNFGLLLMRVPKLPRKSFIFLLLLVCGGIESCPEPFKKILLIYQNWEKLSSFTKTLGAYSVKKIYYKLCLQTKNLS